MNAITTVLKAARYSSRRAVIALALLAGGMATTSAQTVAFTNNPVATTYGGASDNGPGLNIGDTFTVSGAGIEVFQLGAFDWQGDGLAASHVVTLFHNQTPLASVTVPAGTAATLLQGFRFQPLTTPIYLPAGHYGVVAYQMNGGNAGNDPYGENNAAGFNGSANLSPADGVFQFTTTGSPLYPNQVAGGYDFAAASFTYTNATGGQSTWNGGGANSDWSTAGNWTTLPASPAALTFAGSTRLNNTNDLTGFAATSILFDAAAGAFVLNGNDIALGGTLGFSANPAAPVTQTVNLNMAWSTDETIDTPPNGNLNLGGNITSGNWLTKIDNGTLTLGGTNTFAALSADGGTNIITGNTSFTGGGEFYLADGDFLNGCKGTVVLQPGGTLTVTGNYNDAGVIGRDGGSGTIVQNGGTFNFNIGNNHYLFVGAANNPATRSEYDMNAGLLDMNGNTLGIALGSGVLVTGLVNQAGGVITNVGNLYLSPFFMQGHGIYNLTGGSIYVEAGGITNFPGGGYEMNLGGGMIGAEASWASTVNLTLTGSNGPVTFNPAGNVITLSGVLSGTGGLVVSGGGTLELSGANTYTGSTTVNTGSTLQLDSTGSSSGAFRVANGGVLNLNFTGTYAAGGLFTNGVALPVGTYNSGNLPGFIIGSGNLQVASGISTGHWTGSGANNNWSTAGNWDNNAVPVFPIGLTFAGSTRLVNNNDLTAITVSSFTFDSAAGAFVLGGNDITLNGNLAFNGNPAAPVTQTINLNMTWNADKTIDTPTNGNLALGGNITTSGNNLTKVDGGTLTLGGTDGFSGLELNGGTNVITGNVTFNGTGGSKFYLGDGDAISKCSGALVIQPGATLSVTGNFGDAGVVGRDGGSGAIVQNGGLFSFAPGNQASLYIGATSDAGTQAEYDMNGGTLDMNGNNLGIGLGDNNVVYTALLNQSGGAISNVFDLQLGAVRAYGRGVYNLSGGTLYLGAGGITTSSGNYGLNLGGGTIVSSSSWISTLNVNLTNLNGSVTFNQNGNTVILSGAISGTGGLNVTGGGTLDLSGATSYSGDTAVDTGTTLELDVTGSSQGSFRLTNGAMLNLTFGGNYVVAHLYTNGVALANGVYNSGNLPGYITGSGNLQVTPGISTGHWTGFGANNNWSTPNNWDNNALPVFPIALTFAGSTQLANNNDLSGITANGITFDAAAGAFVLNGNPINLNGNVGFNSNPAAPVTQTVNLALTFNGSETIETPTNANLVLGGNLTSSVDTSLVKLDAGSLVLGGANSLQSWDLNGGTTTITGNTSINGGGNSRIYIGDGDATPNCNGRLILQPGASLNIGGNYADAFVIGRDSGSGKLVQNGGTFSFNPANQTYMFIGAANSTATRAEYDMNGGLLDMNGKTLGLALGVNTLITGVVSQASGIITNVGNLYFDSFFTAGHGIYNLTGGSLYIGAGGITVFSGGTYEINLGGGTIGAEANWSSSMNLTLTGSNGPVTFNPAGNTITLSGVISGHGGLSVAGGGKLELSGANTYTGDTSVGAGSTLQLDAAGTSSGALRLVDGATLNANYTGTYKVGSLYTNGVALALGTYNIGNLPAFIAGTGNVQVVGAIPNTPTNVSFTITPGHLNISWPASYQGWILQQQTNALGVGLSTNWVDVAGSANVTATNISLSPATPAVFYRLRYPTP